MSTLVFRFMTLQIRRADLPPYALIAAWVLSMVSLPVALWTIGNEALAYGTTASVLLLVAATVSLMVRAWGWQRALRSSLIVIILGWLIEFVGSKTGFPFGSYSYTNALQPQLLGVPLLIPLAWLMMMPSAWAVAQCIVFRRGNPADRPYTRIVFILVSALAFTAWDLFLDPQMTNWGFWTWHNPSGYFGIPFVNFAGWILAALLMTTVVRPPTLPREILPPLLAIYGITIFLQTVGVGLFWGMPAQAICGFIAMSACFVPAIKNLLR
jgi:lycopene beta-cyclase